MTSEFVEGTAEFGLKNHHESNGQEDREAAQDPAKHREIEELGNEGQCQENERQSDQNAGTMGAAQVEIEIIQDRGEYQNLQSRGPVGAGESQGVVHHFIHDVTAPPCRAPMMDSVIRSASRCGAGS